MNICIVGWYGTETLGDRSILLGLAKAFEQAYGNFKIYLGSIYPFHSKRCLLEDMPFLRELCPSLEEVEVFDSKNIDECKDWIGCSDLVAMGGGPIMDIPDLALVEFSFGYAKSRNVKTALLGCGIGPLYQAQFRKIAAHILELADLTIFRDDLSQVEALRLAEEHGRTLSAQPQTLHDPAIIPAGEFLRDAWPAGAKCPEQIIINFRHFPAGAFGLKESDTVDNTCLSIIKSLATKFKEVLLFPMHTFHFGGDDRLYLAKLCQLCTCQNVAVKHEPMSLKQLFELIRNTGHCVGMRYHAVVLQTLLNGSNAIVDYTAPGTGKTSGFLKLLNAEERYKSLYLNIQEEGTFPNTWAKQLKRQERFTPDSAIFKGTIDGFASLLRKVVNISSGCSSARQRQDKADKR